MGYRIIYIIWISCLLGTTCLNAQKYRVSKRQKDNLLKTGDQTILSIEDMLDRNEALLYSNVETINLKNPTRAIEAAKKKAESKAFGSAYKNICMDCYLEEYRYQSVFLKNRNKKTSTETYAKMEFDAENDNQSSEMYSGYKKLASFLDKQGNKEKELTVFANLDVNFSMNRLPNFLSGLNFISTTNQRAFTSNALSVTFISKDPTDPKDLILKMTLESTSRRTPAYYGGGDRVSIVKTVEVIGPADIISYIFMNYWSNKNVKSVTPLDGELASISYLGDRIGLKPMTNHLSKLVITPIAYNYFTTFGIE